MVGNDSQRFIFAVFAAGQLASGSQQRLKEKVTGRINDAGNCAYPPFELVVVVRQAAEDRSIGAGGVEAALRKSSASSEAAILEELP